MVMKSQIRRDSSSGSKMKSFSTNGISSIKSLKSTLRGKGFTSKPITESMRMVNVASTREADIVAKPHGISSRENIA